MCKYSGKYTEYREKIQEKKYRKYGKCTKVVEYCCRNMCANVLFQVPDVRRPVLRPPVYFTMPPPASTRAQSAQCATTRPLPHPPGWMTARWSEWSGWSQWIEWSQWTEMGAWRMEWTDNGRRFRYVRRRLYMSCPVHNA